MFRSVWIETDDDRDDTNFDNYVDTQGATFATLEEKIAKKYYVSSTFLKENKVISQNDIIFVGIIFTYRHQRKKNETFRSLVKCRLKDQQSV